MIAVRGVALAAWRKRRRSSWPSLRHGRNIGGISVAAGEGGIYVPAANGNINGVMAYNIAVSLSSRGEGACGVAAIMALSGARRIHRKRGGPSLIMCGMWQYCGAKLIPLVMATLNISLYERVKGESAYQRI